MKLTKAYIKYTVTSACVQDPALACDIAEMIGFEPKWSKMGLTEIMMVWFTYLILTSKDDNTESSALALAALHLYRTETLIAEKEAQKCTYD